MVTPRKIEGTCGVGIYNGYTAFSGSQENTIEATTVLTVLLANTRVMGKTADLRT